MVGITIVVFTVMVMAFTVMAGMVVSPPVMVMVRHWQVQGRVIGGS